MSTNVTAYITVLGTVWSSVVNVADFLQTDDLYQLAQPRELPELPDFTKLSLLTCGHAGLAEACLNRAGSAVMVPHRQTIPGRSRHRRLAPADSVPAGTCAPLASGRGRAGRAPAVRRRIDAQGGRRHNAATSISKCGTAGRPPACRSSGSTDDHKPVRSGA